MLSQRAKNLIWPGEEPKLRKQTNTQTGLKKMAKSLIRSTTRKRMRQRRRGRIIELSTQNHLFNLPKSEEYILALKLQFLHP
jgi:hypothetical protein